MPVPTNVRFSRWFQKLLEYKELSQADAARMLGMGTGRLSEWATGKATPSAESCRKIARVFTVDEDEVLVEAGRRTPDPHYDPNSAEARLVPIVRAMDWTPAKIEAAVTMLDALDQMARELQGVQPPDGGPGQSTPVDVPEGGADE